MAEMTPAQAISVLIQGCEIGQKAGAYSFEDSSLIASAIKTLTQQSQAQTQAHEVPVPEAQGEIRDMQLVTDEVQDLSEK